MSTRDNLLRLLEENMGDYVSGESLAESLNVSRNAIWKSIKSLKSDGYNITAITNRGYCLSPVSDVLSAQSIEKYLDDTYPITTEVFSSIDSTNLYVKKCAMEGAREGLLVVSKKQENGRGRRGRSFYSPDDTGVYFSILLKPHTFSSDKSGAITTMAAVAVSEAIEKVTGKTPGIKWVNDVFLNGKKVCGILTEASYDIESNFLEYAVLGIGINAYTPKDGFPDDIKDIAGSVFDELTPEGRSRLVAETINSFLRYYNNEDYKAYVKAYKEKCFVLGKPISVISPAETKDAIAIDLDDDCHLLVEYPDGSKQTLSSGEISIKVQ